jgi:homocitrate synthase NifV
MERKKLLIVDTTLRDGEQRAGLAFSQKNKVNCARILDDLYIYQIEAGIPSMGSYEKDTIAAVIQNCKNSLVSVWCRMVDTDINDAFDCHPHIIHISVPVSDIQIETKLAKSRQFVEDQMQRCIYLAAERGYEVTLGFEDASRAQLAFMSQLAKKALNLGVRRIRYADTVGVAFPHKIANDISKLIETGVEIEMHAHDDLGLAVANTLEAAKSGALFVDTTFFGIGERAGNCNFRKFIVAAEGTFQFGFNTQVDYIDQKEKDTLLALDLGNNENFSQLNCCPKNTITKELLWRKCL